MKVYGLTGGVGMGKSASDKFLRERGISVIDTDEISRYLVEPGKPALKEIQAAFGPEITDTAGRLRRDELARHVFGDPSALRRLEEILHPRIRAIWLEQLESWRAEGRARAAVIIPLLFETDAAAEFDATICVVCSAASQLQRLQSRGWDNRQIQQRISAQWPVAKKMELADYVIWTEGEMEMHAAQLDKIISSRD